MTNPASAFASSIGNLSFARASISMLTGVRIKPAAEPQNIKKTPQTESFFQSTLESAQDINHQAGSNPPSTVSLPLSEKREVSPQEQAKKCCLTAAQIIEKDKIFEDSRAIEASWPKIRLNLMCSNKFDLNFHFPDEDADPGVVRAWAYHPKTRNVLATRVLILRMDKSSTENGLTSLPQFLEIFQNLRMLTLQGHSSLCAVGLKPLHAIKTLLLLDLSDTGVKQSDKIPEHLRIVVKWSWHARKINNTLAHIDRHRDKLIEEGERMLKTEKDEGKKATPFVRSAVLRPQQTSTVSKKGE